MHADNDYIFVIGDDRMQVYIHPVYYFFLQVPSMLLPHEKLRQLCLAVEAIHRACSAAVAAAAASSRGYIDLARKEAVEVSRQRLLPGVQAPAAQRNPAQAAATRAAAAALSAATRAAAATLPAATSVAAAALSAATSAAAAALPQQQQEGLSAAACML